MTKLEHQRVLFGSLFNGLDQPLKFISVTDEQIQDMLQRRHDPNPYKAEPLEAVLHDIGKRRKEFVLPEYSSIAA